MGKVYTLLSKILFQIIMAVAVMSVNTTCTARYYQEKLDDQLQILRKYKDE